jgi:hypothetical protein
LKDPSAIALLRRGGPPRLVGIDQAADQAGGIRAAFSSY